MPLEEFPLHFRLLLLAARTHQAEAELAEIDTLVASPALDWPEFLAITLSHRLATLVHQSLRRTAAPAALIHKLWSIRNDNDLRAIRASLELQRILRRFDAAGLPLIALKGLTLSQTLYGNPKTRHVGDLDLFTPTLEPRRSLPIHVGLLGELGYTVTNPPVPLTPRRTASYTRFWKDLTFHHVSGRPLDLHWRLFNNRLHPGNALTRDATPVSTELFGVPTPTLPAGDQFLHAALHGTSDSWIYLKTLSDVATYLRQTSAEALTPTLERARALKILPQVSSAIHFAREWMGATATHPILLPAADPFHSAQRARTLASLRTARFRPVRKQLNAREALRLELELAPNSTREIALRYLYRPRIWSLVDLPDALFPLYPIVGLLTPPRIQ